MLQITDLSMQTLIINILPGDIDAALTPLKGHLPDQFISGLKHHMNLALTHNELTVPVAGYCTLSFQEFDALLHNFTLRGLMGLVNYNLIRIQMVKGVSFKDVFCFAHTCDNCSCHYVKYSELPDSSLFEKLCAQVSEKMS